MKLSDVYDYYVQASFDYMSEEDILDEVESRVRTYYKSPEGQQEIAESSHDSDMTVDDVVYVLLETVKSWIRMDNNG